MAPRKRFFRTRVAGRILGLFFVGSIVPVLVLQVLSFRAVSSLLEEQSEDRLAQLADATVQIILERLASSASWVESAGRLIASTADVGALPAAGPRVAELVPSLAGVAVADGDGVVALAGDVSPIPTLADDERRRIRDGHAVLTTTVADDATLLHLALPANGGDGAVLWAKLRADSIWASAMVLGAGPRVTDMCVLGSDLVPFACKTGPESELPARVPAAEMGGTGGLFRFEDGGEAQLAAWKRVYLRSTFGVDEWIVVVTESESSVHAPVASFAYNLPLALAVGLGLVLLLASFLVGRTMGPLEQLTEGTRRIAGHDLGVRVDVGTDDEFGELADSFNTMARRLARQFTQIEAAHAIDRAVIEDDDASVAVAALIDGVERIAPPSKCAVLAIERTAGTPAGLYRRTEDGELLRTDVVEAEIEELEGLVGREPTVRLSSEGAPRLLREAGWVVGGNDVHVVRMSVQDTLIGYTVLDDRHEGGLGGDELDRVRRLINQAGVALNENRLRRELVEFGGETLKALANAIDAKSRWTTGHSERVTDLAWAIGRELGLGAGDLETLHRGGLLHDLGKIGVSTEILDHPGRLDRAQRRAVEAHTVIGARILEPIRVFRPLVPIVLHHHERWDGDGYPEGLSGYDIPYLARVLAVADVFDALASPRPYREALPMDFVLAHVRHESGRAFDPEVVQAFDAVLAAGWAHDASDEGVFTHDG